MTTLRKTFGVFGLALALLCSASLMPAAQGVVEANRAHSAAGQFGCTVSGATVATPSVITCSAAHGLADGDAIQITGIVGTTTDNVQGFAKVTGQSSTTFALYSDVNLQTGVTGTGTYSSGGVVTEAFPVATITGQYVLRLRVEGLTSAKKALISVQSSTDGFVSVVKTLGVLNLVGPVSNSQGAEVEYTIPWYKVPSSDVGVANGTIRLVVQAVDSTPGLQTSLFINY